MVSMKKSETFNSTDHPFQKTHSETVQLAVLWFQERYVTVTIRWDDKVNFTADKALPMSNEVSNLHIFCYYVAFEDHWYWSNEVIAVINYDLYEPLLVITEEQKN